MNIRFVSFFQGDAPPAWGRANAASWRTLRLDLSDPPSSLHRPLTPRPRMSLSSKRSCRLHTRSHQQILTYLACASSRTTPTSIPGWGLVKLNMLPEMARCDAGLRKANLCNGSTRRGSFHMVEQSPRRSSTPCVSGVTCSTRSRNPLMSFRHTSAGAVGAEHCGVRGHCIHTLPARRRLREMNRRLGLIC